VQHLHCRGALFAAVLYSPHPATTRGGAYGLCNWVVVWIKTYYLKARGRQIKAPQHLGQKSRFVLGASAADFNEAVPNR
jgi:hypothetical protein